MALAHDHWCLGQALSPEKPDRARHRAGVLHSAAFRPSALMSLIAGYRIASRRAQRSVTVLPGGRLRSRRTSAANIVRSGVLRIISLKRAESGWRACLTELN